MLDRRGDPLDLRRTVEDVTRRKGEEPVRITSAARPRSEDIRGRERRYIMSMAVRTLCFLLAIVFRDYWVVWVFLAGAVLLPYVAVVIANAGVTPDPDASDVEYHPDLKALAPGSAGPHDWDR